MNKLLLVGDSVLDNGAYVPEGSAVSRLLADELGTDWRVELLAVDGALVGDVHRQVLAIPSGTSLIVLSVGGNDAGSHMPLLGRPVGSVGEALAILAPVLEGFAAEYRALLAALTSRQVPILVCTVYEPWFDDPAMRRAVRTGVALFNDIILREAAAHDAYILELRDLFTDPADFAQQIEPSAQGGSKLAKEIARRVLALVSPRR